MKKHFWVILAVIIGLFGYWSGFQGHQLGFVVWATSDEQQMIPEEAVRLRILAHSDSLEDQRIKRLVRDQVVKEIQSWQKQPTHIDEARQMIMEKLPRFSQIVNQVLQQYQVPYSAHVDYGAVPFPTKLYGEKVYPAGEYEALRITLGSGQGDNWWCVLFPPLCFIDMESGQAFSREEVSLAAGSQVLAAAEDELNLPIKETKAEVKVGFFLVDQLLNWWKKTF